MKLPLGWNSDVHHFQTVTALPTTMRHIYLKEVMLPAHVSGGGMGSAPPSAPGWPCF